MCRGVNQSPILRMCRICCCIIIVADLIIARKHTINCNYNQFSQDHYADYLKNLYVLFFYYLQCKCTKPCIYLLIPELYRTVISYILIFVHLSFYEKLSVLHVPVFLFTVCKLFFPCTNLLLPRYI